MLSPADLERDNPNLVGGDSLGGSHHLDQNFLFRPAFGWSRYRTPVARLYMVGASTWPGAGTGAGSGFMLAKALAGPYGHARCNRNDCVIKAAGTASRYLTPKLFVPM